MAEEQNSGPVKNFRAGALNVSVWANKREVDGKEVEFHNVTIKRGYKDKDDKWQNTDSLRTSDLPKAVMLLNKAYEHLTLSEEKTE